MIILTRIYRINFRLVVAQSAEDAIEIYKNSDCYDPCEEIVRVELMTDGKSPVYALKKEPDGIKHMDHKEIKK